MYPLAFGGYVANPAQVQIELTYNQSVSSYEMGGAYLHIAIGVDGAKARASGFAPPAGR